MFIEYLYYVNINSVLRKLLALEQPSDGYCVGYCVIDSVAFCLTIPNYGVETRRSLFDEEFIKNFSSFARRHRNFGSAILLDHNVRQRFVIVYYFLGRLSYIIRKPWRRSEWNVSRSDQNSSTSVVDDSNGSRMSES